MVGIFDKYSCSYRFREKGELMSPEPKQVLEFSDFPIRISRSDRYNWSYSGELNEKYRQFAPSFNATEYDWFMTVITKFKSEFEANGITYMLLVGSVLGAYRYHGFVPWDDDFDVQVNASQRQLLMDVLSSVPRYGLITNEHYQWKFYPKTFGIRSYSWKWPFVDIFFFDYNETHVYDVTLKEPRHFFPRSVQLPILQGIFENLIMPVPNNMEAFLEQKYNMNQPCKSNYWDHKRERGPKLPSIRIPCKILFNVYAVVHRFKIGNISIEELRLGNKTLYRVRKPNVIMKNYDQEPNVKLPVNGKEPNEKLVGDGEKPIVNLTVNGIKANIKLPEGETELNVQSSEGGKGQNA